ncbi:BrnA antitoxin family protein [Methylobacterium sp. Gmos1]
MIERSRATDPGWQTRINEALRQVAETLPAGWDAPWRIGMLDVRLPNRARSLPTLPR